MKTIERFGEKLRPYLSSVLGLVVGTTLISLAPASRAVEQLRMNAVPDPGAQFGYSVALTEIDGLPLAVVGAPGDTVQRRRTGAAHVVSLALLEASLWPIEASLWPSDGEEGDRFGASVAIFAIIGREGRALVLVGAPNHRVGGVRCGAAYLFEVNLNPVEDPPIGSEWREIAKLVPSDPADNDGFGTAVGLDGTFVAIGAPGHDDGGLDAGGAYLFVRNPHDSDRWTEFRRLQAPDGMALDRFGHSLALKQGTVLIGAPSEARLASGAAYLFSSDSGGPGAWGLIRKLTPTNERGGLFGRDRTDAEEYRGPRHFGWSVDLDLTGPGFAIVGAPFDPGNGLLAGAAYIFERDRGGRDNWGQVQLTASGDGDVGDEFGTSVAIAADFVLVGSPQDDDLGARSGSVYLFRRHQGGENMWGRVSKITAIRGMAGDEFGRSCALATVERAGPSPVAVVGQPLRDDFEDDDSGEAYELFGFEETLLALPANKDSFLRKHHPDLNEGAHPGLRIQRDGLNRVVVGFDGQGMATFLNPKGAANPPRLLKATLALTIKEAPRHWSERKSPAVFAHPLEADFVEGNGQNAELPAAFRTRGSGPGVTWNCPADTEIANHRTDCPFGGWEGGLFGLPTASGAGLFEDQWGEVQWDVTTDVQNGFTAWLLKKDPEDASGEVWFFSKEGANMIGSVNPDLAPRLILEIAIED